jgi:hypothetical protein
MSRPFCLEPVWVALDAATQRYVCGSCARSWPVVPAATPPPESTEPEKP